MNCFALVRFANRWFPERLSRARQVALALDNKRLGTMRDENKVVRDDPRALPRDVSRFRSLYPNGRAIIRDNPTLHLPFLTTYEMTLDHDAKAQAGLKAEV